VLAGAGPGHRDVEAVQRHFVLAQPLSFDLGCQQHRDQAAGPVSLALAADGARQLAQQPQFGRLSLHRRAGGLAEVELPDRLQRRRQPLLRRGGDAEQLEHHSRRRVSRERIDELDAAACRCRGEEAIELLLGAGADRGQPVAAERTLHRAAEGAVATGRRHLQHLARRLTPAGIERIEGQAGAGAEEVRFLVRALHVHVTNQ
jgi:hypothetical protein